MGSLDKETNAAKGEETVESHDCLPPNIEEVYICSYVCSNCVVEAPRLSFMASMCLSNS